MDALLGRLGAQAMNYAIRSGIVLTSNYAVGQCSRLLKTVDDRSVRAELKSLQDQLNGKVKILSPVIDLIEFKSVSLVPHAVVLTNTTLGLDEATFFLNPPSRWQSLCTATLFLWARDLRMLPSPRKVLRRRGPRPRRPRLITQNC